MQYLFHLKHEDTAKPPITKLETLLFKALRLSQASLSCHPQGVCLATKKMRERRERREKTVNLKTKLREKMLD